jgi:hypothetical protein
VFVPLPGPTSDEAQKAAERVATHG